MRKYRIIIILLSYVIKGEFENNAAIMPPYLAEIYATDAMCTFRINDKLTESAVILSWSGLDASREVSNQRR